MGEIQLVYQPIARLNGDRTDFYDVLVRLPGDDGAAVLPGEFLPAAERTGPMPRLDRWIIQQAFEVAADRCEKGLPARIFLRVAGVTLHDPEFFGWLGQEALGHKMDPGGIVMQVSEATAEGSIAQVREFADTCKDLQFQFSLATDGRGRNAAQLIDELPVDYVVLNGSLVQSLGDDERRGQAEKTMAAATSKKVPIIATGVERAATLAHLYHLGVDYVVGYLVQEPDLKMADETFMADLDDDRMLNAEGSEEALAGNSAPRLVAKDGKKVKPAADKNKEPEEGKAGAPDTWELVDND